MSEARQQAYIEGPIEVVWDLIADAGAPSGVVASCPRRRVRGARAGMYLPGSRSNARRQGRHGAASRLHGGLQGPPDPMHQHGNLRPLDAHGGPGRHVRRRNLRYGAVQAPVPSVRPGDRPPLLPQLVGRVAGGDAAGGAPAGPRRSWTPVSPEGERCESPGLAQPRTDGRSWTRTRDLLLIREAL